MFSFCSHPKAADRDRRHTRIVVDGVPLREPQRATSARSDATLHLELGLAEGSVPWQHQGPERSGGELGQVDLRFGVDHRHRLGIDDNPLLISFPARSISLL
jgi:hypothetical protein